MSWLGDAVSWTGRKLFGDNRTQDQAMKEENFRLQGGDYLRDYAAGQLGGAQGRLAPQARAYQLGAAAQIDPRAQAEARARMMGLADQYQGVASGQQRGAGELAVGRQMQQAAAAQFAGANMARGANAGIAARAASRQLGDMGTNAAGMASQSALQDQAAARAGLGGLLGQLRGQDLDLAAQNAQLQQQRDMMQGQFGQQTAMANQAAALQQTGMNDQYGLGLMGQYLNTSDAELRARVARAQALAAQGRDGGLFGAGLQAAGGYITARGGAGR